jgi:hypothetical protein
MFKTCSFRNNRRGTERGAATTTTTAPRKNARALQLAQKKQVVDVPRQQREQHEDDAI